MRLSFISLSWLKAYANITQQCTTFDMYYKTVARQLSINLTKNSIFGIAL